MLDNANWEQDTTDFVLFRHFSCRMKKKRKMIKSEIHELFRQNLIRLEIFTNSSANEKLSQYQLKPILVDNSIYLFFVNNISFPVASSFIAPRFENEILKE